jgi:hypothetical protein
MKNDTITIIASGALLAVALLVLYVGYLRRRHHVRRLLVMDLLRDYFRGDMPAPQLKRRTREIASQHFTSSDEFYALSVSAFQGAADSALASKVQSKQSERQLLNAMANLKQQSGLTDRYQVEAWRPGRE